MATTTFARPTSRRPISAELAEVAPAAILALLMTGAVIYSLSISGWAPGLNILLPMGLPGLLVGIVFARLSWLPGWLAHLLSSLLGVTWAVQLIGGLMDERLTSWRDQATDLLIRTLIWARVIGSGGRGEDILLFVAALCLLCWGLAYSTGWMVFRRGWVWPAVVLNAVLALINYTYVLPKPTVPFFVFLTAALLLVVYQHVVQRQHQWDAEQIEYPDLLPIRFIWSAALVCGLLILITAVLPGSVTVERASRTWEALSAPFRSARERWEDLFSTINAPPGAGSGSFTLRSAALGGARLLSDAPVMTVRSTEYDYWRAMAMDRYTGSTEGWQNTIGEQARAALGAGAAEQARTPFEAGQPIPLQDTAGRRVVTQTFVLDADREDDLVFVGGTAGRFSLPTAVEHNYLISDAGATPNYDDTALVVAREELRAGDTYTVTALVSRVDVESLRNASQDYPAWVRDRYLQLPDSISLRTRELAANIVAEAGATTPYDQAIAIQDYLRSFVYTESMPRPPDGVEPVDWFLFEQRAGYCDYFASSMVVMLRSQGIPARWVRGYAGGEFDTERGVYVVKENLAHTWPEVYFPGVGWERFEPTPASYTSLPQRPLTAAFGQDPSELGPVASGIRPNPSQFEELDPGLQQFEPGTTPLPSTLPRQNGPWPAIIGGLLAALALLAAAIYLRWRYELRGLSRIGQAYAGMELLASWGGRSQPAHTTPREYAEQLSREVPEHSATIRQIAGAYQAERYRRARRADLPPEEAERELRWALARRIFTGIAERLPQPRERR